MFQRAERLRGLLLVALTASTGAVDAISWLGLGKVFSAFMTGNFVFLGLRAGGAEGPYVPAVLSAVAAFGAGAFIGARMVAPTNDSDVAWPRRVTAALAATLIAQAVFWALWIGLDAEPSPGSTVVPLALYSLAMGAQTAVIFSLGVRAVFTTAATATWTVLIGDLSSWSQPPYERFLLAAVLVALLAGAVIGGFLVDNARDWAPIVPFVVTGLVVAVAGIAATE
jgi:uncharacterized membrane protein YoaK (UPF0700 family)